MNNKKCKNENFLEVSHGFFRDLGRIFEIIWDFLRGFQRLRHVGPC